MSEKDGLFKFEGRADRTQGRRMLDTVADPTSFVTRIEKNLNGTTTRMRTRGGAVELVTDEPEGLEEILLPTCAAIPVSIEAPWGFSRTATGAVSSFPISQEPKPASALLTIRETKVKMQPNKLYAKSLSGTLKNHPGNRNWYDCRPSQTRGHKHIVSWWCPLNNLQPQLVYVPSLGDVWLGESGLATDSLSNNHEFTSIKPALIGAVFIDGKLEHDFQKYVLAAALESSPTGKRLLAVTSTSISVDYRFLSTWPITGANVRDITLSIVDLATGELTETVISADVIGRTMTNALTYLLPQFSPDAAKLVFAKFHSLGANDGYLDIYERDIAAGTDTFIKDQAGIDVYDSASGDTYEEVVFSIWYNSDSELRYFWRRLTFDPSYDFKRSGWWHGEYSINAQPGNATEISFCTEVDHLGTGGLPSGYNSNDRFVPLAADGFGGVFAGAGPLLNVGTTTLWKLWDGDPAFGGYSGHRAEIQAAVFMPNKAGTGIVKAELPDSRIPISMAINGGAVFHYDCFVLPRPFHPDNMYLFGYDGMSRFRIAFGTNPERTKFIASLGTVAGQFYAVENIDGPPTTPELDIIDQGVTYVGAVGSSSARVARLDRKISETYGLLNSPIFFARERSLRKPK